eukprot:gene13572-19444_t
MCLSHVSYLLNLPLQIIKTATLKEVDLGEEIWERGDPADAAYLILSGSVALWEKAEAVDLPPSAPMFGGPMMKSAGNSRKWGRNTQDSGGLLANLGSTTSASFARRLVTMHSRRSASSRRSTTNGGNSSSEEEEEADMTSPWKSLADHVRSGGQAFEETDASPVSPGFQRMATMSMADFPSAQLSPSLTRQASGVATPLSRWNSGRSNTEQGQDVNRDLSKLSNASRKSSRLNGSMNGRDELLQSASLNSRARTTRFSSLTVEVADSNNSSGTTGLVPPRMKALRSKSQKTTRFSQAAPSSPRGTDLTLNLNLNSSSPRGMDLMTNTPDGGVHAYARIGLTNQGSVDTDVPIWSQSSPSGGSKSIRNRRTDFGLRGSDRQKSLHLHMPQSPELEEDLPGFPEAAAGSTNGSNTSLPASSPTVALQAQSMVHRPAALLLADEKSRNRNMNLGEDEGPSTLSNSVGPTGSRTPAERPERMQQDCSMTLLLPSSCGRSWLMKATGLHHDAVAAKQLWQVLADEGTAPRGEALVGFSSKGPCAITMFSAVGEKSKEEGPASGGKKKVHAEHRTTAMAQDLTFMMMIETSTFLELAAKIEGTLKGGGGGMGNMIREMSKHMQPRKMERGDILLQQGEAPPAVFILVSGSVGSFVGQEAPSGLQAEESGLSALSQGMRSVLYPEMLASSRQNQADGSTEGTGRTSQAHEGRPPRAPSSKNVGVSHNISLAGAGTLQGIAAKWRSHQAKVTAQIQSHFANTAGP